MVMFFREYMERSALTDEAMAALLGGCSAHAVKKWRYRERVPRPAMLRKIVEVTGGAVTASDFLEAPAATVADSMQEPEVAP